MMTADSTLDHVRRIIETFKPHTSHGSLQSQAQDCASVVAALGYEELSQFLTQLAKGE